MQKLEEVLRAEESARHAVDDARDRAASIVREADLAARRLVDDARAEATAHAAREAEERRAEAHRGAESITHASREKLESLRHEAAGRRATAVEAALAELLG